MSAPNIIQPIRIALLANSTVTNPLASYKGAKCVFTRRPVPIDVPYPMIVVSPDISLNDEDGINDFRPRIMRDIIVYGQNDAPEKYRAVEEIAYAVRLMFHGKRTSIVVPSWGIIDIRCTGPIPAPTDDEKTVARSVTLTVRLAQRG